VVRETDTVVPKSVPPEALPSNERVEEAELKFAVSVIGELIVIDPGLAEPVKEPGPVPVQLLNVNPLFAAAEIDTVVPESYHPVSPEMLGAVVAPELPPLAGEFTNVT
jgi:hypothetical protein